MDQRILPLIAVRDVVVFPGSSIPISIKREQSVAALEEALGTDKVVFLTMQKNKETDKPSPDELYTVGTISKVTQIQRLPDGIINVLVSGQIKAKIKTFVQESPFFKVSVDEIEEVEIPVEELSRLLSPSIEKFKKLISFGKPTPIDVLGAMANFANPLQTLDVIISNLDIKSNERQSLLEENNLRKRLKIVDQYLANEISILGTARKIQDQTAEEIGKSAKEVFLREQLKTIEKELGMKEEKEEFAELEKKIRACSMSPEVETKALKELDRLRRVPPFSPEVSYIRTYLDLMVDLPWNKRSETKIDVKKAEKILNEDHYGLYK